MGKQEQRKVALQKRHLICMKDEKSARITQHVIAYLTQHPYKKVGIYAALDDEVQTQELYTCLWNMKIETAFPRCVKDGCMHFYHVANEAELQEGFFHIMEPLGNKCMDGELEVILIPLVAYDKQGNRLGYGKGYYDRFLAKYPTVLKIGLAFEEQEQTIIYKDAFDEVLDMIITEVGIIYTTHKEH